MDAVQDWLKYPPPIPVTSKVPIPFGAFGDPAGYLGVLVKPTVMRQALRQFMSNYEPYMQAAHQVNVDEGCSVDDSHKLTKHVCVRVGKIV